MPNANNAANPAESAGRPTIGRSLADEVSEVIGRACNELLVRRQALAEQIREIDEQMTAIRDDAHKQLAKFAELLKTPAAKRAGKAARQSAALRLVDRPAAAGRRSYSPETRRRMSLAAKRRWRETRKQNPKATRLAAK